MRNTLLLLSAWTFSAAFSWAAGVSQGNRYANTVRADNPVAYWRFGPGDAGAPPLAQGGVELGVAGPRPGAFPDFEKDNTAASFDGEGAVLKIADPGPDSEFDFDAGDTVTLEGWVDLRTLGGGQNVYVVGKGRTENPGLPRENQNYALRLREQQGEARISFVFRSRGEAGAAPDFHRWTASEGFHSASGWHHVAVTYTFGKKGSLRAYQDGQAVKGGWDLGGETERAPVVDDDEIWIGSSRGGSPGNSFNGCIDEVAIYRGELSKESLGKRFRFVAPPPQVPADRFQPGKILVEVYDAVGASNRWPGALREPAEVYYEEAFGFFQLPVRYGEGGVRVDRRAPFMLRAYAEVELPGGAEELLVRSRCGTRLWIAPAPASEERDGGKDPFKVIATTPFLISGSDGHGPMEDERPPGGLRPPRMGDNETRVAFAGGGARHRIVWDILVDGTKFQPGLGESTLAAGAGRDFEILAPGQSARVPLTDEGWEAYSRERAAAYHRRDTEQRRAAAAAADEFWRQRHALASAHVAQTPGPAIPEASLGDPGDTAIDRFITAKIRSRQAEVVPAHAGGGAGGQAEPAIDFDRDIKPILADNCFRCHGEKEKGGLRLNDRDAALAGGESGEPALDPGRPDDSLLVALVSDGGEDRMPPKGERLSPAQIDLLKTWIAQGAPWGEGAAAAEVPPLTGDLAFLRRIYLDTAGVIPSLDEIRRYLDSEAGDDRRARLIDRLLDDPRWADHWVGYWQDVLAENPNILKPSLNNSGPFRWWIHESFLDNKPMDRFVTELIGMRGSVNGGGPAGFSLAAENDVPMAAKAHIVGTAFLGVEMKCARCHDSPYHSSKQRDLFEMAAMLGKKPLKVPESSSVPASFFSGRKPLIEVSLDPGEEVAPAWPFPEFGSEMPDAQLMRNPEDPREQLAAFVTRPENDRFAKVIVNRVWKQYFGQGIVEPAHDWEGNEPSHPELLEYLAREFTAHGYDLKHVARLILNSHAYQRESRESGVATPEERLFAAPDRRRLTAEQIVDSLYLAAGRSMDVEELNFDVEGYRSASQFLNLGVPTRAWQFASLSNERDRPSLSLPKAQAVLDVLEAFGWRSSRQEPRTERETDPNVLQPGVLGNGIMGTWLTKLTDSSELTEMILENRPLEELINALFLRIQTRPPTAHELAYFTQLLEDGYASRVVPEYELPKPAPQPRVRRVSWSNHLNPEANTVKLEMERVARAGEPATLRLRRDWRERMEDMLWALMNSPEGMFVP